MSDNLVTISEHGLPYVLVKPGKHLARTGPSFGQICTYKEIPGVLADVNESRIVAIDFETRGDYVKDGEIVGAGLATDSGSYYFDFTQLTPKQRTWILSECAKHPGLIAHNVYFDGAWMYTYINEHANWLACTYGLYMQTANEGFPGQRWSLKEAMVDLLGWENTNEEGIDTWLIQNGYANQQGSPVKSEMWRVPSDILGKYCMLDADATWLLFTHVLEPVATDFPKLIEYHQKEFMTLVKLLIEQRINGLRVNKYKLAKYQKVLQEKAGIKLQEFLAEPEVAGAIRKYEQGLYKKFLETEPKQFKKFDIGPEPARFRKSGKESDAWKRWKEKKDAGPQVSKNWLIWESKRKAILNKEMPEYLFNVNSRTQLRWLLFQNLFEVEDISQETAAIIKKDGTRIEVDKTESGQVPTDSKAMTALGGVGSILVDYYETVKELSYIDAYADLLDGGDRIYPSFRVPGTLTGRLSGKDPNIQQMPKTIGTMELFIPDKGNIWVDLDFASLEPVVTAELTQDPGMMEVYGPYAKVNDLYLFVAAHISGMKEKLAAVGYNPYSPTAEAISRAKKECKRERNIAKTVALASAYGAGVTKIRKTLMLGGINLSFEQVKQIHTDYWTLFSKVKSYSKELEYEWRVNGGYVLNAFGRPMCIAEDYLKDSLNRVVQSSGHDILMVYICILAEELNKAGIPWKPIIIDWHDSVMVEVPEQFAEQTAKVFEGIAMYRLNKYLDTSVVFKGTAQIARNLAEAKEPES